MADRRALINSWPEGTLYVSTWDVGPTFRLRYTTRDHSSAWVTETDETPEPTTEAGRLIAEYESGYDMARGAEQRALKLLRSLLTPTQLDQFNRNECFAVRGSKGGWYVVDWNTNLVFQVTGNHRIYSFCLQPKDWVPDGDALLARKVMIEADERGFLAKAVRTHLVREEYDHYNPPQYERLVTNTYQRKRKYYLRLIEEAKAERARYVVA